MLRYDELLHLREWKPEDKEALRARFLGGIMKSLETMCETRLQQAAQFVDLCEHNQGCITPAENFIADLMLSHYFFGGLIPDEVKDNLEGPEGFEAPFISPTINPTISPQRFCRDVPDRSLYLIYGMGGNHSCRFRHKCFCAGWFAWGRTAVFPLPLRRLRPQGLHRLHCNSAALAFCRCWWCSAGRWRHRG